MAPGRRAIIYGKRDRSLHAKMKPATRGFTETLKSGGRPSLQIAIGEGEAHLRGGDPRGLRAHALASVLPTGFAATARRADAGVYRASAIAAGVGPSTMDLMQDSEYGWPSLLP